MGVMLDKPWQGETFSPPTPIDIAAIENALLAQLKIAASLTDSALSQVELAHFPDRPEAYRMTHRVGAVLVRYAGSRYGKLLDTEFVVQERNLSWDCFIRTRDLGWAYGGQPSGPSPGAYGIIEAARAALAGFWAPGASTPLRAVEDAFEQRDAQGGVWEYRIRFEFKTMAVQQSAADNLPLFIKGQAFEESGQTIRAVAAAEMTFDGNGQILLAYQNSSAVIVSSIGGTVYVEGTDYSVDAVNGIISRITSGAIPSGAAVNVAYSYAEVVTTLASGGRAPTYPTN